MSRRTGNGQGDYTPRELTLEEIQSIEQSLDAQLIQQVKEILSTLWKQGRITLGLYAAGTSALSAGLYAIENPGAKAITLIEGMRLCNVQWQSAQEHQDHEF